MATAAPSLGPKASAAMRQTMPDGSYMSHGAMGKMGICTKLRMSEAAVKSAASAILRVSIALFMERPSVSSIRTIPSAPESHRVGRACSWKDLPFLPSGLYRRPRNRTGSAALRGSRAHAPGKGSCRAFTAGGELHPALKQNDYNAPFCVAQRLLGYSGARLVFYTGEVSRCTSMSM